MDVDGDVDGTLAQAFGCMGTNDREVLVRQFQQLLGENHQVSAESCAFFLDMNNWNLQAALGSYYDYGSTNGLNGLPPPEYASRLPSMQFVQDITIGEGESVPPSTRFIKTWRIRNCSAERWPDGCFLSHIEGEQLADSSRAAVPTLQAGEEGDVSVEMTSPALKGIYQSRWQLNTPSGLPFGESIWCIITVEENGLLGITQQLASAPLGCATSPQKSTNPFGSLAFAHHQSQYEELPQIYDQRKMAELTRIGGNMSPGRGSADGGTSSTPSSSSRDASLLAVRGSPPPSFLSNSEYDAPASPNGSSSLYEAVAAAFPQQWQQQQQQQQQQQSSNQASMFGGGGGGSGFTLPSAPVFIQRPTTDPPDVPPCTPCTPPDRPDRMQS